MAERRPPVPKLYDTGPIDLTEVHIRAQQEHLRIQAQTQNFFVDSTISKDRTEGRKQDEEEALKSLPQKKSARRGGSRSRSRSRARSREGIVIEGETRTWTNSTGSSIAELADLLVDEPPPINLGERGHSPIPWRQDLELRHSSMPQAAEQTARGVKDDCGVSESVVVETLSKGKDEMKDDRLHEAMDEKDSVEPSVDLLSRPAVSDLATKYSKVAELDLGVDLYNDNPFSNFVSKLLDTEHKLQAQLRVAYQDIDHLHDIIMALKSEARAPGVHPERSPNPLVSSPKSPEPHNLRRTTSNESISSAATSTRTCGPRHQVLYKVICDHRSHRHGSGLSVDIPVRRGLELNGRDTVWNLTEYLFDSPEIVFIVFKGFSCDGVLSSPLGLRRPRNNRSEDTALAQPRAESEAIYVVSDILRTALIDMADCLPFDGSMDGEMLAPYLFLYHHRTQLDKVACQTDLELAKHVSCLMSYVKEHYGAEYDNADAKFAQHVVTGEHLTKLWVPNQIVVSRKGIHDTAYVLAEWPERRTDQVSKREDLGLDCWLWDYDGTKLQRKFERFTVSLAGHDEMPIGKLLVFPLVSAAGKLSDQLRDRGRKFWNLRHQHLVQYNGLDFNMEKTYSYMRFMVDTSTYTKLHKPSWDREERVHVVQRFDTWPDSISHDQQLNDRHLTIMPPHIYGFDFREKEWVSLCVDAISTISWNKEAYDRLVLPTKTKELIQALVTVQVSGKMQDIVAGKGNGLILLLHGGPGTGKTLTAETVAEMAEKPLYRVTCGDIGTDAVQVEKYLTSIFYLGRIWGCVLLLDEADVFLEERKLADLQRNSLVSVFLRMLEYYNGILILTSNRVGTFDAAFKSRIQVALHYSNFSRASRKKIWRNFFDMLEEAEDDADINELERHLDDLANDDMNGRQIRNCVTTARQLAAFRNQRLGWQHLEQAIKTAREFEVYLKEVHENMTEEEIAREDNLR